MIVRSITIANWRCFLNEIVLEPFELGLNVVYAPNGTGKSAIFEAFRCALLDGHRVTGREVEAIRPWGRALSPKVTAEFEHEGREYRVKKQFIDSPAAMIERKENGRFQKLAEGLAADKMTRDMLTKNPQGRGLARPENWGLAQVLWASQGNLVLGSLSGDLITDIRDMLGSQIVDAETGPIENRIKERYLEIFTPTGRIKSGTPLLRLREALEAAKQDRKNKWATYNAFEEASARLLDLQSRRVQARYDLDQLSKDLRDARAEEETYRNLCVERTLRSERVSTTEAQYRELKQQIELIKSTESELVEAQNGITSIESEIPLREREVHEREDEATRLTVALEDIRKGREAVDAARLLSDTARRFNDTKRQRTVLDQLIERVIDAEKTLAGRSQKRSSLVAPDIQRLSDIRKAIKNRDDIQARISSLLNAIKSTEIELDEAKKHRSELEKEISLKEREAEDREQEAAQLRAALEDIRRERETIETARSLANSASRFNHSRREKAALDQLIEKVKKEEQTLAGLRQEKNTFVAPNASALRAIRKAIQERDDTQIRIDASLITLEIVPEKKSSIRVIEGETIGDLVVDPAVPTKFQGSPQVVVDLPGIARMRAWGPARSIEEYREVLAKASRKLDKLVEPYGTADINTLEALADKAQSFDAAAAEAETRMVTLLSGKTIDELEQVHSVLATRMKGYLETHPSWATQTPDAQALESETERINREFIAKVEGAEAVWTRAQTALTDVSSQKQALRSRLEDTQRKIQSLSDRLGTLRGGSGVEQERKFLQQAKEMLRQMTEPYGTDDIGTLETLVGRAQALDAGVSEIEIRIQTLLSGRTMDEFVQDRDLVVSELTTFLESYPDWAREAPDAQALEAKADEITRKFVAEVEDAERAWVKAQTALTAVAGHREALLQRFEDTQRKIQSLKTRLISLADDGRTAPEREMELQRVSMAWDSARSRLQEIEQLLAGFIDDPGNVVRRLEIQVEEASHATDRVREQEIQEETRLESLGVQGPYSALVLADEAMAQLEQEVGKEELRVEAIRLLNDTVAACRQEAIASVTGPVEAAATRIFQRIAGRRLGSIRLGSSFVPSAVVPESVMEEVHLNNLSGGEQEQLYLAARLALAEVLGRDNRQLVVLDDVLTATDSGRLARVMNILEEAAERLQIVVMTCHPERYRGLQNARFFDLETIAHDAR